jgi:predicted glycoside hydrolase/deacetylase ChbG (UPF0249 family)
MTRLILCADDYGLAPGVGRGIRQLLAAGRLSATSCMTVSPHWPAEASALLPFADKADIGLHLTLTDQQPLGPMARLAPAGRLPGVGALLGRGIAGRLDADEIRAEIERQVDGFETHLGRPPDFLDGHQHVQQFPGIRDAVIDVWRRRLAGNRAWLRVCDEPAAAILRRGVAVAKSLLIAGLGRGLRRQATAAGIPMNDRFAGIHDFSGRRPYGEIFERFVAEVSAGGERLVVMCHPGVADDELRARDPVTGAREDELRYFASAAFPDVLRRHKVELGRFA